MKLIADPKRVKLAGTTGIYVRATRDDRHFETVDIAELDRASLLEWLRSRSNREWAESVVLHLLGHSASADYDTRPAMKKESA